MSGSRYLWFCGIFTLLLTSTGFGQDLQNAIYSGADIKRFQNGKYQVVESGTLLKERKKIEFYSRYLRALDAMNVGGFPRLKAVKDKLLDFEFFRSTRLTSQRNPLKQINLNLIQFSDSDKAGEWFDDFQKFQVIFAARPNPSKVFHFGNSVLEISSWFPEKLDEFEKVVTEMKKKVEEIGDVKSLSKAEMDQLLETKTLSKVVGKFWSHESYSTDSLDGVHRWCRYFIVDEVLQTWIKRIVQLRLVYYSVEGVRSNEFGSFAYQFGSDRDAVQFARDYQMFGKLTDGRDATVHLKGEWVVCFWRDHKVSVEDFNEYKKRVLIRLKRK